jgi:hypothetical protein
MRAVLRPSVRNEEVFDSKSEEYRENSVALRHFQRIDYLVLLLNNMRLDIAFISGPLICEIVVGSSTLSIRRG